MWTRLLWLAVCIGLLVSSAGLLAPILSVADFANHARPFVLFCAATLTLLVLSSTQPRPLKRASFALLALNVLLLVSPLPFAAGNAGSGFAALASHRQLKVITFNMAWADRPIGDVIAFLSEEDADIVALQEATAKHGEALRRSLAQTYPFIHSCHDVHICTQMLLSKHRWVEVRHEMRARGVPEMIWARFDDSVVGRVRVHSLHMSWPFEPEEQDRQIAHLISYSRALSEPAIFAGDFNLTPWSYQLVRLLAASGLRRHTTWLRSWPTDGQLYLTVPTLLIDHVLTTSEIGSVSVATGANLGSDHLPVIARLVMP